MSDTDPRAQDKGAIRRRRPRLTAEETRERMFMAAKGIVQAGGVTIDLGEIVFDNVIERADVPRSSAYNQWPTKAEFVNDLLLNFAGPDWMGTAGFDPETLLVVTDIVLEHWHLLETEDGRRAVVLEAIRQAVERNITSIVQSVDWEVYVALVATARGNSNDEGRQLLAAELQRAEVSFVSAMAAFYAAMCTTLGIRLRRASVSFRHLAVTGAAVVEGIALRKVLVEANATNERVALLDWSLEDLLDDRIPGPTIGDGAADWSLAAWAFLGIFDGATEPDPDWRPTPEGRAAIEALRDNVVAGMANYP